MVADAATICLLFVVDVVVDVVSIFAVDIASVVNELSWGASLSFLASGEDKSCAVSLDRSRMCNNNSCNSLKDEEVLVAVAWGMFPMPSEMRLLLPKLSL